MKRIPDPRSVVALTAAVLVVVAAESRTCAQATWRPVPELRSRRSHALAYDPLRQRVVLFGGLPDPGFVTRGLADTWEWEGSRWFHRVTKSAPSPRWGHRMAYDPVRRTVLLFGGWNGKQLLGDTWEWDGRDWRQVPTARAPSPREAPAMAMDPVRNRIVLFGGNVGGGFPNWKESNDTWEWDGRTWTQRFPRTIPKARIRGELAFNAKTGRCTLFGGTPYVPNDTWEWDGKDWRRFAPKPSPPARSKHALASDPVSGGVLLYGGSKFTDTWLWDGVRWTQRKPRTVPPPQRDDMLVTDWARRRVVLFGGGREGKYWDVATWLWDGTDWSKAHEWPRPVGTVWRAVHDTARDQFVLVGPSETGSFDPLETWTFSQARGFEHVQPLRMPSGRAFPYLVYHAGIQRVVLHGGLTKGSRINDTWLWDGKAWSRHWSTLPAIGRGSVYDSHREKIVLLEAASKPLWEWDPKSGWTRLGPASAPPISNSVSLAYDPARRRIVMYGGLSNINNDTWEWDGRAWRRANPVHRPPRRIGALMAYVPALGGVVMTGGFWGLSTRYGDTWLWDGRDWKKLALTSLPTSQMDRLQQIAYDPGRQRLVVFPWFAQTATGLWELAIEPLTVSQRYPRLGETFTVDVALRSQAGNPFLLLLAGANRPGIPLRVVPYVGVELLPLRADALLWQSFQAGLVRGLDASGRASFAFRVPKDPSLHWVSFHAAGFTVRPGLSVGAVTNDVHIEIVK